MNFARICAQPEYAVDNLPEDSYERGYLDGLCEARKLAGDFVAYEYGEAGTVIERIEYECAADALQSFAAYIESESLECQVSFIEALPDGD